MQEGHCRRIPGGAGRHDGPQSPHRTLAPGKTGQGNRGSCQPRCRQTQLLSPSRNVSTHLSVTPSFKREDPCICQESSGHPQAPSLRRACGTQPNPASAPGGRPQATSSKRSLSPHVRGIKRRVLPCAWQMKEKQNV
ncbi:hypothetical protein KIL84_008693 [Mauremys mutica]|uniref:Uncharacterized protein n=1 Tax=Mauremys mutica TaxID=74926 RepID=A0A9D4ASN2_9SAUR|nr:hypothetical protein KIL84_008693 [Mauremys mutica]